MPVASDLEDAEQAERAHHRYAERLVGIDVGDDHLEYAAHDDDAVELVERRVKVLTRAQAVHFDGHLEQERAQEEELGVN